MLALNWMNGRIFQVSESVAAILGAVAWPGAFLVLVFVFRSELKSALNRIPIILDRVRKASLAGGVL